MTKHPVAEIVRQTEEEMAQLGDRAVELCMVALCQISDCKRCGFCRCEVRA